MRLLLIPCAAVMLASTLSCAPVRGRSKTDPTIAIRASDPEMNAAIEKARATLPTFFVHWKHPGPGESDFNLKLRITDDGSVEHFWLGQVTGTLGQLSGVVDDTPQTVHSVKLGQRIPISVDQITDWMYLRDGKIVGNLTMKVLFKHMHPKDVAKLKASLADP